MRSRLLLLLVIILLSSCANISVKDFGPYWNKGMVDSALLGWWQVPDNKEPYKIRIMNRAATYQVAVIDKKGWETPEAEQQARTLRVGNYSFLMTKMQDRPDDHWAPFSMTRYRIEGDQLQTYSLDAEKMEAFLAKEYPGEANISANVCKAKKKNTKCYPHITIEKLDKDVYNILSSIPDTKAFWAPDKSTSRKIQ